MRDLVVISGGQRGADRGALIAAQGLGYFIGGWCPKGRKAEDGVIPSEFPLVETESEDYRERTRMNVMDANATLLLSYEDAPTGGTKLTLDLVGELGKRGMYLTLQRDADIGLNKRAARFIRSWIEYHRFEILNVAGPRESKARGIEHHVTTVMRLVLQHRDGCICGRAFPPTIWENKAFAEEGSPLRCSACGHTTLAADFQPPPASVIETIRSGIVT